MPGIGFLGLSGLGTSLIAIALSGVLSASGGFIVAKRVYEAQTTALELKYALAQATAVRQAADKQHEIDQHAMTAALTEAASQQQLTITTEAIQKEVTRYVKVPVATPVGTVPSSSGACITVGFVRVIDAASLGVEPSSLPDLAGKPDDACAAITPPALADAIIANYGTCRQNAEQLNALIALVRAREDNR